MSIEGPIFEIWSAEETAKLRQLHLDPTVNNRQKLVSLVKHFQGGGSAYSVWYKGVPEKVAQHTAEKIRALSRDTELDWLLVDKSTRIPPTARFEEEEWPVGYLSGSKETLRGIDSCRWSTDRTQKAGDEFLLDLGDEYVISEVVFQQGTQHQWDHPKKWSMKLTNGHGKIILEIEGEGFIEHKLERPLGVRYVGVSILEPRLSWDRPPATCWAVDTIKLACVTEPTSLTP